MHNGRLKDCILSRVHVSSNVCLHCVEFGVYIMSGSTLCEENNFKPCLTKQLLKVFKLWCEGGISLETGTKLYMYLESTEALPKEH